MRKIAVLDQNTIDKIAAGEVVERPSSVVKELVENAIDAGATAVTVEITDGGKKLIRITDNGSGMEEAAIQQIRNSRKKERGINGIGIGNVIERIQRNYGKDYYVDIRSRRGTGTHITLVLPLLRSVENEDPDCG